MLELEMEVFMLGHERDILRRKETMWEEVCTKLANGLREAARSDHYETAGIVVQAYNDALKIAKDFEAAELERIN